MHMNTTPFDAAWQWILGKVGGKVRATDGRVIVFACPDCEMPIDENIQKSNIRVENVEGIPSYLLSCTWCHRVFNIGTCEDVDKRFVITRKEVV